MNNTFNIVQAESMWLLGLLRNEELPDLAIDAISKGYESESTLQLAVCAKDDSEEIERLFRQMLVEGGGGGMSKIDALKHYAKQISSSILSEKTPPLEGARLIWDATLNAQVNNFHDLDSFIYAASEMEDRPSDKAFFEKAIIDEAKRWVVSKETQGQV